MGCQWLIAIALVHISGYEDAGLFALAMSIANVFSTFANYGMRSYQATDTEYVFLPNHYLFARLGLSCVSALLCCIYLRLDFYNPRSFAAIMLYLCYSLTFQISDIIMGNLQRENRLELNGFSNSMRGFLCLALFLAGVLLTKETLCALGFMGIGSLIVLLFYDIPLYRCYCPNRGQGIRKMSTAALRLCRKCFFVSVSNMIPIVITAIPRREIQRQLGEEMLGYFSSVYTPMVILNTIIPSLILALIPGISYLWKAQQEKELRKKIGVSYGIVIIITILAMLLSIMFGKPFLKLLYGAEIVPYTSLMYYSVVAIGLNCACVCGNYILIAFEKQRQVAMYAGVSLLTAIMSSTMLIRNYQLRGAAYILIASYAVQTLLQTWTIAAELKLNDY